MDVQRESVTGLVDQAVKKIQNRRLLLVLLAILLVLYAIAVVTILIKN